MKNSKSQFLNTREEIIKWLDKYHIKNYTVNDDLSVDVNDNIDLSCRNLKTIRVKFGKVIGSFNCSHNYLTSLTGSPEFVGGYFDCDSNQLVKLTAAPKIIGVGGGFWCRNFWCQNNPLTSFLEIINCDFNGNIFFNIDEKNFKQKELIQILKKYYDVTNECYKLTFEEFRNKIKTILERECLLDKLNKSYIYTKTKNIFI